MQVRGKTKTKKMDYVNLLLVDVPGYSGDHTKHTLWSVAILVCTTAAIVHNSSRTEPFVLLEKCKCCQSG